MTTALALASSAPAWCVCPWHVMCGCLLIGSPYGDGAEDDPPSYGLGRRSHCGGRWKQIAMEAQVSHTFSTLPSNGGRQWLASRLLQRPVVNVSTVAPVGHVADVAFDPESCQVTGLMVEPTHPGNELVAAVRRAFGPDRTIGSVGLDHIIALNSDMVTVDSDPVVSTLMPPRVRAASAASLGKVRALAVITFHGMCLGSLADLLVDDRGTVVTGYVVNPTRQAESLLQPFEELEYRPPLHIANGADAEDAEEASPELASSAAHWRVIPASPRVRVGKELILVVEEVEPLQRQPVVITRQQ